jgi:hypothetical protein
MTFTTLDDQRPLPQPALTRQEADDGDDSGSYTGALLRVWNGAFDGDYARFHQLISEENVEHRSRKSCWPALPPYLLLDSG